MEYLRLWGRADVLKRALKTALIVGTVLVAINHADAIATGSVDWPRIAKMLLTYCVPYAVSSHSSVAALRTAT